MHTCCAQAAADAIANAHRHAALQNATNQGAGRQGKALFNLDVQVGQWFPVVSCCRPCLGLRAAQARLGVGAARRNACLETSFYRAIVRPGLGSPCDFDLARAQDREFSWRGIPRGVEAADATS